MSDEKPSPGAMVVATLKSEAFQQSIVQALPPGVTKDRFTRAAITAIQKNPGIVEGDKNSLYSSLVESAQVGLLCDGKQAALVIYNTNVAPKGQTARWIKKVQFMPMIGGIILNLGRVGVTVDTQVVHEKDAFALEFGDSPSIKHVPVLGEDRGKMIGAYAICRTKEGTVYREWMNDAQIEAVRNQSKAKDSLMWTQFASEGWRKTVLRRCSKRIPILDEVVARTLEADDKNFSFDEDEMLPVDPSTVVSEQDSENTAPPETPAVPVKPANGPSRRPTALKAAMAQDEENYPPPDNEVF